MTTPATCLSYITFRSTPTYNTPVSIAYLLNASATKVARLNISHVSTIPPNTIILVPIDCSCSAATAHGGPFYQHQATYSIKVTGETYVSIANNTYQGFSTCQSMIAQNPYDYRQLLAKMRVNVPLRCACPSQEQSAEGYKYLLSFLITWRDDVNQIAQKFSSSGTDNLTILDANELKPDKII